MSPALRTLLGVALGLALVLLGVPVLQALVARTGYFASLSFHQACLALLVILVSVVVVHLVAPRPNR